VTLAVRVRKTTADDLARLIEADHVPEITVSQLLRRYIAQGIATDNAGSASQA
jgi:hypothetical protein